MNASIRVAAVVAYALLPLAVASASAAPTCEWTLFPTLDPYRTGNQLVAVAGTGASDVWEVGASFRKTLSLGYVLHWNGSTWTAYKEADPLKFGGQFSGVAAPAAGDVWAVGSQYGASGYRKSQAAIEHWTGSQFAVVAAPAVQNSATVLYGVAAFGSNDIWAAGGSQATGALEQSYLIHWDGSAWTQAASPNVPKFSTNLTAVAGSSSTDVWSVGDAYGIPSSNYQTLAEHWDGSAWTIVPTQTPTGHSGRLNAVTALSPTDAWAVGQYVNGSSLVPLTEHWNGSGWTTVPAPDPGGGSVFLLGVTAVSSTEVWAVGEIARGKRVVTYALRWDGTAWKVAKSQNVPKRAATLFNGVAAIPGAGLWAVGGDASAKDVIDTVTEQYSCGQERPASPR